MPPVCLTPSGTNLKNPDMEVAFNQCCLHRCVRYCLVAAIFFIEKLGRRVPAHSVDLLRASCNLFSCSGESEVWIIFPCVPESSARTFSGCALRTRMKSANELLGMVSASDLM